MKVVAYLCLYSYILKLSQDYSAAMSPSYCPTLGTIFYNGDSLCLLRSQEKVDVQEKKVFGYLLSPHRIYQQAVADGTAIKDQSFSTVMLYMYQKYYVRV